MDRCSSQQARSNNLWYRNRTKLWQFEDILCSMQRMKFLVRKVLISLDSKVLIIKFGKISGFHNINWKDDGQNTSLTHKYIVFCSTTACVFAYRSFGPNKLKPLTLVEGEYTLYWFGIVLLLLLLETKTRFISTNAQFVFLEYFNLIPLRGDVRKILNYVCFQWIQNE